VVAAASSSSGSFHMELIMVNFFKYFSFTALILPDLISHPAGSTKIIAIVMFCTGTLKEITKQYCSVSLHIITQSHYEF
jgi:hypothetical protein